MASWLGNFFTGNNTTTDSTTSVTGGTFAGVGQTTPSTLPYTTPTTHVGTTGYVSTTTTSTGTYPTGGLASPVGMGVYNPNQTFTIGSTNTYQPANIHISGPDPVFSTDKGKLHVNELIELVETLKERLLILTPNFEKHEKYAALKKAYDNYKLIEAMLSGEDNDNK